MLKTQRGFSLLEILIVLFITSIVMTATASAYFYLLVVPPREQDQLRAINDVRVALDRIQYDGVQAMNFTGSDPPDYGYFSWVDYPSNSTYRVTYSYDDINKRLIRKQSIDGGDTTFMTIAFHVAQLDHITFEAGAYNSLNVTVMASLITVLGQEMAVTDTRHIEMRAWQLLPTPTPAPTPTPTLTPTPTPTPTPTITTLYSTADSRVVAQVPTTNYGTDTAFAVQAYDSSTRQRGLIRFDLSSIPPGSTINSATFSAYYWSYYAAGLDPVGRIYYVYRITAPWTETGVTWNNQPGSTTVQKASVIMPGSFDWVDWNVKDIVQSWVDGTPNYGFLMIDGNETQGLNTIALFYSKEYFDIYYDPILVIDYTP